jgi:putative ABC transport system ATP-binding protein
VINTADPVLRFEGVRKSFSALHGRVEVLRGVDLTVNAGEFIAITGPSGSGKSTLLHLASLLDYPTTGNITFEHNQVTDLEETQLCELRKYRVGMVFQNYCLLPHRSVLDNVMFRFRYVDHDLKEAGQKALAVLRAMGLEEIVDRPARLLSGGEMQRVAIARAVALRPRLLVADEPTGNLDAASTCLVMESFKRLHNDGLSILLVTHNESLLGYCTRHVVCEDGKIKEAA